MTEEDRRLFRSIIIDLVSSTRTMGSMFLLPAGLTNDEWTQLRNARMPKRGGGTRKLSKADIADRLLVGLSDTRKAALFPYLVAAEAGFNRFELSRREDVATNVVRAAQSRLRAYQEEEERRAAILSTGEESNAARLKLDRKRDLLVGQFDDLLGHADPQERGRLLEVLLNDACRGFGVQVVDPFIRDPKGVRDQIDGGIIVGTRPYTVECKWTKKLTARTDVDGLIQKVNRSPDPNMWGMLLSVNGWASTVVEAIKVDRNAKNVILVDGVDFRVALAGPLTLSELVLGKSHHCTWRAEPYVAASVVLEDLVK